MDKAIFTDIIAALDDTIYSCFSNTTQYWGEHREGPFYSHFDWHSSVHGHWAYMKLSRICGRQDHPKTLEILGRLTRQGSLSNERDYLRANPSFELPYGQAWLLLLLKELKYWIATDSDSSIEISQIIDELSNETLLRVVEWLENGMLPDGPNHTFIGSHNSWTMSYFLLKKSTLSLSDQRMFQLDNKFAAAVPKMTNATFPHDFHSPLALAEVLRGTNTTAPMSISSICRPAKIEFSNCHSPGLVLTTYWPMAARAGKTRDVEAMQQLIDHLRVFMQSVDWKGDFMLTTHWVPQFLFFAVWLAMGEP